MQNGFVPMRPSDVSSDDTVLDGETAGYTLHEHDRPKAAFELGPECNGCEIIFPCSDASDDNDFNCYLYGWPAAGPGSLMADISCTIGLARIKDVTTALYVDTISIDSQNHIKTLSAFDSGNDRIARIALDTVGLKYLYPNFYDVSDTVNAYIRTF